MANVKAAKKSARKDLKKRTMNRAVKTRIKNLTKKFLTENDIEKKKILLNQIYSYYDKAVKKNIIKKNNAGRKKSQLAKLIYKQMQPQEK